MFPSCALLWLDWASCWPKRGFGGLWTFVFSGHPLVGGFDWRFGFGFEVPVEGKLETKVLSVEVSHQNGFGFPFGPPLNREKGEFPKTDTPEMMSKGSPPGVHWINHSTIWCIKSSIGSTEKGRETPKRQLDSVRMHRRDFWSGASSGSSGCPIPDLGAVGCLEIVPLLQKGCIKMQQTHMVRFVHPRFLPTTVSASSLGGIRSYSPLQTAVQRDFPLAGCQHHLLFLYLGS